MGDITSMGRGSRFFGWGDTAWPLFGQYSRQEAEQWLEVRARKGFTVVQGVLGWGGGAGIPVRAGHAAGDMPSGLVDLHGWGVLHL